MNSGIIRNVELHYNNGSLSDSEFTGQVLHIIPMLYMLKVDVFVEAIDSGGFNCGLVNALRNRTIMSNLCCFDNGNIELKHPCSKNPVAMYYCKAHDF